MYMLFGLSFRYIYFILVLNSNTKLVSAELSVGPFCVTWPNPTHQLTDPTQPTTSWKIWTQPDPTQ